MICFRSFRIVPFTTQKKSNERIHRFIVVTSLLLFIQSPSQSAPTILNYQVDLIIFKGLELLKNRGPCFLQKPGCKKQGHCYSKREKTRLPLLFLNNNDLGFLHPPFSKTDPGFQNKNSGCRLIGRLGSSLWDGAHSNFDEIVISLTKSYSG